MNRTPKQIRQTRPHNTYTYHYKTFVMFSFTFQYITRNKQTNSTSTPSSFIFHRFSIKCNLETTPNKHVVHSFILFPWFLFHGFLHFFHFIMSPLLSGVLFRHLFQSVSPVLDLLGDLLGDLIELRLRIGQLLLVP